MNNDHLHRCTLRFSRTSKDHNYPVAITRHRAPGYGGLWWCLFGSVAVIAMVVVGVTA